MLLLPLLLLLALQPRYLLLMQPWMIFACLIVLALTRPLLEHLPGREYWQPYPLKSQTALRSRSFFSYAPLYKSTHLYLF